MKVGKARKAAEVPYPYGKWVDTERRMLRWTLVYAEKAEAEKDPLKHVFNCVQRAHQNTLEMFPVYTTFLLIGGLKYPEISAGAGIVYLLGRALYASGYSTGSPDKRRRGVVGYLGFLTLIGTSSLTVYNLLKN